MTRETGFVPAASAAAQLPPPTQNRGSELSADVVVYSHTGEKFRFYQDLIERGVVTINFMSIRSHPFFPVTDHLANIARRLGDRLGSEVFMYSITKEPEDDTPLRLRAFAAEHRVPPGWLFLTTSAGDTDALSHRLFPHRGHDGSVLCYGPDTLAGRHGHPSRLVHYGNGAVGLWSAFPADCDPELALRRLSWVRTAEPAKGRPRRAGPRVIANDFRAHNREA